jgi:hypothetical protein
MIPLYRKKDSAHPSVYSVNRESGIGIRNGVMSHIATYKESEKFHLSGHGVYRALGMTERSVSHNGVCRSLG